MKNLTLLVCLVVLVGAAMAAKKEARPQAMGNHIFVAADSIKWGPPPAEAMQGTPPPEFASQTGLEVAVLEGDPGRAGQPFTLRLRLADGYRVAPHWHPTDEHITVIEGHLSLAVGDKFSTTAEAHDMLPGAYAVMPKNTTHFAWSQGSTIVQVHGTGPFKIIWANGTNTK